MNIQSNKEETKATIEKTELKTELLIAKNMELNKATIEKTELLK